MKALLDRLPTTKGRKVYYLVEAVIGVVMVALFIAATMAARGALAGLGLPGVAALLLALVVGALAVFLAGKLVGLLVTMKGGDFADWHPIFTARMRARCATTGWPWSALASASWSLPASFSQLSMTFEPEQDVDNSRVRLGWPGHDARPDS